MIRHVLLDADGVLQRHPVGWAAAAEGFLGERGADFFRAVTELERTCLSGDGDFLPLLTAELAREAPGVSAEELYVEVWHTIETVATTLEVVHELRDAGLGVHLGTNQHERRAAYMRRELGYDELFDESFYSCDLGAAKPAPAFFASVLDRLDAAAPDVLFVDDSEPNVVAARECGLAAERWHVDDGIEALRDRLSGHGVVLS
ncbi:hypothetical protein GCM10009844_15100 [Nocardioides koreensis]|uniref:Hydrolase of the HAD superfamily n=1 Tax=Nocardioides koreensis TaxID=433651 RepID=A0ABP5L7R7_9ACTN